MQKYPIIGIRITQEEKARLKKEAGASGMTLSQYIRYLLDRARGM